MSAEFLKILYWICVRFGLLALLQQRTNYILEVVP